MADTSFVSELDHPALTEFVANVWEESIVPELIDYIAIPNQSPAFDEDWEAHGYMAEAVALIETWCRAQAIEGLTVEVVQLDGRTPVIYMEVSATSGVEDDNNDDDCVLLYGHLDKQPEMTGWREDLGPWKPKREGDRLYGRGGADDGYAAFASLTAIRALQTFGGAHARCSILIEACEESGSFDLPYYIDRLAGRIGSPSLVVCLDSGCGNYDQLWSTTSLRGLVTGTLRVDVLNEGVHSGDASGVVPSSFRILRALLDRIEDPATGEIRCHEFHAEISQARRDQAALAAQVLGDGVSAKFPFTGATEPVNPDHTALVLNRTMRPALSVTGVAGMPSLESAGNVLRPYTSLELSLRLPPTINAEAASLRLKEILEANPPYGATVSFELGEPGQGWEAPALASWLGSAVDEASTHYFGAPAVYMGEGGSIPFMGMLGEKFPAAQFLITGVLGPGSNAHGPNEFLDISTGKRVTCCVAEVLGRHVARER
jgi:acetylornithine deacetylase/succinyl-diaminopimelate desuccinylase-like protein